MCMLLGFTLYHVLLQYHVAFPNIASRQEPYAKYIFQGPVQCRYTMSRKSGQVTATQRLKQDYIRLKRDPVPFIVSEPSPGNILEWYVQTLYLLLSWRYMYTIGSFKTLFLAKQKLRQLL